MSDNPHENHRSRMRKKFIQNGLDAFEEHEVLEVLLYYCYPRRDTNEMAHGMIKRFGSLANLLEADANDIMAQCGCTESAAVLVHMIPALANYYLRKKSKEKIALTDVKTAGQHALNLFIGHHLEVFYLLCLDARYRLNHESLIAEGTLDETPVYPRLIVGEALRHQAAHVILAHNHPGGSVRPSRPDQDITRRIQEGLSFIKIRVLDHIIVSDGQYYSFAAHGQIVSGY